MFSEVFSECEHMVKFVESVYRNADECHYIKIEPIQQGDVVIKCYLIYACKPMSHQWDKAEIEVHLQTIVRIA